MRPRLLLLLTVVVVIAVVVVAFVFFIDRQVDPAGRYTGSYAHGIEIVIVNKAGTYSQSFSRGGVVVYANSSRWKLSDNGNNIQFQNFLSCVDGSTALSKPIKIDYVIAYLTSDGIDLGANMDPPYRLFRK